MKSDLYQAHLNRVSRSFAFGISELQEPLREYVGFAYLFCRLIDTIEDATWPIEPKADHHPQQIQFRELIGFLQTLPANEIFEVWRSRFPKDLPEGERLLLVDSYQLIEDYHRLPKQIHEVLRGPLLTMIRGMSVFVSMTERNEIHLRNLLELNHYCFFVAGVVGEILTGLVSCQHNSIEKPTPELLLESFHFGLFLQKINILKDQAEDNQRGLFFFENQSEVVETLTEHATKAKQYLLSLPKEWCDYRLFCAFSLSLGLFSLPFILKPGEGSQKISRDQTKKLMKHLKELNSKPSRLGEFIQKGIDQIPHGLGQAERTNEFDLAASRFDPARLYEGLLQEETLRGFFRRPGHLDQPQAF